ncbi:MAG: tRNA-specific 2-thiouridylase [Chlamydiales bacterium]|jgi:tRNA-specific 2-thiouridylase
MKEENSQKTVVVGMSGGVDSSVAALLLKEQGYRVIGVFMKNWEEDDEDGSCQAVSDYDDVVQVCSHIGIPHYSVNFSKEYWDQVFSQCLKEYAAGHTPNPDILCNREIKFKVFLEKVLELNADYLATGHYCRNLLIDGEHKLAKGIDPNKDQSYFLYTMKKEILEKVLFPLGGLCKDEIRRIALENGLVTAAKKDSMGICFIGKRNFKDFLNRYIPSNPGNFETPDGKIVGRHDGFPYYTIGQRKGLGIGGPGEAWFVAGKDVKRNVVILVQGEGDPILHNTALVATDITWVGSPPARLPHKCMAKIRYRQSDSPCTITRIEGDKVYVEFDSPQKAITPRQSIVFYDDDICLGGAMIQKALVESPVA